MPSLPALPIDPRTAWIITGLIYMLMPLAVWSVLFGRADRRSAGVWCLGAALSGVGIMSFGLRHADPSLGVVMLGNALNYLGFALRWQALRAEQERPVQGYWAPLFVLAGLAALVGGHAAGGEQLRVAVNSLFTAAVTVLVALEALRLARLHGSRSATLIAVSYGVLAGVLVVRSAGVASGLARPDVLTLDLDTLAVIVGGIVTALWGNIGYLGLAIELAQRRAAARLAELAAATARGEQAERQAQALKSLSEERQELLRVLSHEVRQPLHNAQAVLQSVDRALRGDITDGEAAAARIDRARSVLGQITGGLDNILAASTLLVGDRPTALRDSDIQMVMDLSLGDLPPGGRTRVRIVHDTDVRTAAMDVGLMRLALRNLLNNALIYTPGSTEVILRVADTDEPLAVTFEVADNGPGIAPDLLPQLFERGTRGRHDVPGQGLGLYIVQLAMRRQGGSVAVHSTRRGTVFTLTVPQGQEL